MAKMDCKTEIQFVIFVYGMDSFSIVIRPDFFKGQYNWQLQKCKKYI